MVAMQQYATEAATCSYDMTNWYATVANLRKQTAMLIDARGAHEIALVANTSTGLSMLAQGLDWHEGDEVVTTAVEYPANRYPWQALERWGVTLRIAPQHDDGQIDVDQVVDQITNRTRVVAISHVQFGSGFRIDLQPIADMVHRAGGLLCVDAIQSLGALPVDVQAMGIDFLAADGHKWLLGPEGAGIMYCHEDLIPQLTPALIGWKSVTHALDFDNYDYTLKGDAGRFEPGSFNMPGLLGLEAAVRMILAEGIDSIEANIKSLTDHLITGLRERGHAVFSPHDDWSQRSGIVSFDPQAGLDARQVVDHLAKAGICVALRGGRVRVSPHYYNTTAQIDQLLVELDGLAG